MSVVINTNAAATAASNNLSSSSVALNRSLNRLSSGSKIVSPADDAGGLAVSMKLSAAARRQGAAGANIANTVAFLHTQDGVLSTTSKILNRVSELKTLYSDPTKGSSDKANYQTEFSALQGQLLSNAAEKFNGTNLFSSNSISVGTTEDGSSTLALQSIQLTGTAPFAPFSDNFADLSKWTNPGGATVSVAGNVMFLNGSDLTTNQTFSGAFDLSVDVNLPGTGDMAMFSLGGTMLGFSSAPGNFPRNEWHTMRISFDGTGGANTYIDGGTSPIHTLSGIPTSGKLSLTNIGAGSGLYRNLSVTSTAPGSGDVDAIISATDLGTVTLTSITDSIAAVASSRAKNGASQSQLGFAAELLSTNKANLEQANSRISDVDVAEESSLLARNNVLVQAGTAMLSQANQSSQLAVRLISG